jgi:hypothetical protein
LLQPVRGGANQGGPGGAGPLGWTLWEMGDVIMYGLMCAKTDMKFLTNF